MQINNTYLSLIVSRIFKGICLIFLGLVWVLTWSGYVIAQPEVHITSLGYFGEAGSGEGEFQNARGIALDLGGHVYVVDTGNNRLLKFSPNGSFLFSLGDLGWGRDQFDHPTDICTSLGLDIYIADSYNHRIVRYDNDLNYISEFVPNDIKDDEWEFGFPTAVDVSIHGDLFFVDGENMRIIRVNRLGQPAQSFGGFHDVGDILKEPEDICIGADDTIYILDRGDHQVVIFDYYGNYVRSIGMNVLKRPMGLAVDNRERIFVADADLRQVVVFTREGRYVCSLGPQIKELGREFAEPVDAALIKDRLYVLDRTSSHVYLFRIMSE